MKYKAINLIIITFLAIILTSGTVLATPTSTPTPTPTSTSEVHHTQIINDTKISIDSNGSINIIRNNYSQAIQKYQSDKSSYLSIKQKFSANQGIELEQQVVSSGRKFLVRCDETIINYLDNLKDKLIITGSLEGSRISATNQEFNTLVEELLTQKNNLEQANSRDDLKNYAQSLKQKWNEIHYLTQLSKAEVLSAKVRNLIKKLDGYGAEINNQINKLDEQKVNTENVKEKFVKFNEDLLQVKVFFNNSQGNFATLQETGDTTNFSQGFGNLRQSQAAMKLTKLSLGEVIEMLEGI